jgi:hypothetical protein
MWARLTTGLLATALLLAAACFVQPGGVGAAGAYVQSNSANGSASPLSVTYSSGVVAGNLLVAVCSANATATITGPSGFSTAINQTGDPAQGIFYKVAAGTESNISCSFTAGGTLAIQIYEFAGINTSTPFDAANLVASTGTGATASSGSVVTTNADDLLVAAISSDAASGVSTWTSSFSAGPSGTVGGKPALRLSYGSAYRAVTSIGTYSTTATVGSGSNWRGQVAAFKAAQASVLSTDVVDGSGNPLGNPSVTFSAANRGFSCQNTTATLGTSTQKIRITNYSPNSAWSLSLAASAGATSTWSTGGGTPQKYDYNDAGGSGCTDGDGDAFTGQLSINPAGASVTPKSGCNSTGISLLGATTGFTATNSIVLASASALTLYNCYWDFTGYGLSQTMPAGQPAGSYSLGLTLTVVAN